ncbi:hypothetical protein [Methyloglobulus sp.]|uniref:hypothetical protein n=1 Tax=Methyloglobulus sp. TaxID=2518622 RepID=UPI0032B7C7C2
MKILLSLGLALFSASSLAATPAGLYECSGAGVTVNYFATDSGTPYTLKFAIGGKYYSGFEAEITDEVTVLGHLLTITRATVPDRHTDTLTLLLPDVNVSDFVGAYKKFDTRIFSTRTRTSFGGTQFVEGVIQNNASRIVHCTGTTNDAAA